MALRNAQSILSPGGKDNPNTSMVWECSSPSAYHLKIHIDGMQCPIADIRFFDSATVILCFPDVKANYNRWRFERQVCWL